MSDGKAALLKERIRAILAERGEAKKLEAVSLRAGLSESYLRQFLNGGRSNFPRTDTLAKIAAALEVSLRELDSDLAPAAFTPTGPADDEVRAIAKPDSADLDLELMLARLISPSAILMVVRAPALVLAGYAVGDRVLVDPKRIRAEAGEPVVAQVHDREGGPVETVLRLHRPPLLRAHSTDLRYEDYQLGDNSVTVMGVVVGSFRLPLPRLANAA